MYGYWEYDEQYFGTDGNTTSIYDTVSTLRQRKEARLARQLRQRQHSFCEFPPSLPPSPSFSPFLSLILSCSRNITEGQPKKSSLIISTRTLLSPNIFARPPCRKNTNMYMWKLRGILGKKQLHGDPVRRASVWSVH